MKYYLLITLLMATKLDAQSLLQFNKRFVESEDKWVVFQKDKDSAYAFGFIYIDAQAGLTLNHEGTFAVGPNGEFVRKTTTGNIKYRLQANNVLVAFMPETKFGELQIAALPDWLKYYKTDTNSVKRLHRWGYLYNGYGECAKALTYLENAFQKEPAYEGLAVELAFSYNCLEMYDKAVTVLEKIIKDHERDAYINKEFIFALVKSGQMEKAAERCKKALEICTDKTYNGEFCYNLLHAYYTRKDKENFKLWLTEGKKWVENNDQMKKGLAQMEAEMNQ